MVFSASTRADLRDAERHCFAKLALRATTIIIALTGMGVIGWASSLSNFSEYHGYSKSKFYCVVFSTVPLGLSILWNLVNTVQLLARHRPVHPGANVGLDLIIWLLFVGTNVLLIPQSYLQLQFQGDGFYISNGTRNVLGVVEVVGAVFCFIALVLHFILFIWACVDTHSRRTNKVPNEITQTLSTNMNERGMRLTPQQQQQQQEKWLLRSGINAGTEVSSLPSTGSDTKRESAPYVMRSSAS